MPPERRTRLLLARHGQSIWNAVGRWQGRADPPLSDLGRLQAEDAAQQLAAAAVPGPPVVRIVASPLWRARSTAEIIGEGLGLEVRTDVRFQEWDAGEWTGLTRDEIEEQWPGYLAERLRPPGFEAEPAVITRALAAIGEIVGSSEGGTVLVVTHGGLIRSVERHLDAADGPPVPNLCARELWHGPGEADGAGGLRLGERVLLLDPDDVEVTTPRQI